MISKWDLCPFSLLIVYTFIYLHYANNSVSLSQIRRRNIIYEDIEDTMNNIFTIFCTNQQDFEKTEDLSMIKNLTKYLRKEMITNTTLKLSTESNEYFYIFNYNNFTLIQYQKIK